ncbi:sialate O-acetylesterase [Paraflavisolibacter sp. H34]|uniref:sialate O-acetylesterase n=1 Tax=Huijunlia imazamoxiresistens TaxID=3127457 RepID=UPI003019234F
MKKKLSFPRALFSAFGLFLLGQPAYSQVRLPRLVRDSMVLQRDAPVTLWGWAAPGEKVAVRFRGKSYKTTTSSQGKWTVRLAPLKAGGPYTMDISASNRIQLHDILVGDVWLCAGQSNMVHQLELHKERYADDIARANNPNIRQFWIPTLTSMGQPQADLPAGSWKSAIPEDIRQFSAVAYFFARDLYERYKVPIGLINASVGGTPIEAWTSEEGLKEFPQLLQTVQKNKDTAYVQGTARAALAYANAHRRKEQDKGLAGPVRWYDTAYTPKGWQPFHLPGYWEDQGIRDLDGVVWFRRELNVPASIAGQPAKIALGRIVDADFLYVNGKPVGNTTYQYPQRRYAVPAGLLRAGKNIITVRVINQSGKGGFVPDKPYYLAAGGDTLDLKGDWQYKVGEAYAPQGWGPATISAQNQPTALFNAMVAPLVPYTLKGMLWYQGESNAGKPAEYARQLPALIRDWRGLWGQGELPFLYVQLPNFMEATYLPSESSWARMREAQLKALSVPNTGMAVAIDLGEWNDIHPDNKKDVGLRLATAARKVAYGEKDVVYSGPIYQSSRVEGNKIILSFDHTGSGLVTGDSEAPGAFALAGADKKFVWAQAKIEGNTVVVWNDEVPNPVHVRYAWADNPPGANLYNKEGLPASPFRTDE